jgi:hypothetical protein
MSFQVVMIMLMTIQKTYANVIPGLNEMSNADAQKAIYQWNLKTILKLFQICEYFWINQCW